MNCAQQDQEHVKRVEFNFNVDFNSHESPLKRCLNGTPCILWQRYFTQSNNLTEDHRCSRGSCRTYKPDKHFFKGTENVTSNHTRYSVQNCTTYQRKCTGVLRVLL